MGEVTLRKALDDYKTIYMPYRNFAERTREEYSNDLEDFIDFVERSGTIQTKELSLPIVERYVANLESRGLTSLTRKRKVVSIRSFLLFLYQDGYIENNISRMVVVPFAEGKVPHILTRVECQRLREACAGNPRDAAIIELLLETGIRLSELVRLAPNDIDIQGLYRAGMGNYGSIRVRGGRGKGDRVVPFGEVVRLALRNYLSSRQGAGAGVLFPNRFGKPLGERGVQKTIRKYLKRAQIREASVHTLRHTFGTCHIALGVSLQRIQELMGLGDRQATALYTSFANT